MRMRRDKTGEVVGSTDLAIVVSRRSRREISPQKAGDRHKERKKEEQKESKAGGHCGRQ